MAAFYHLSFNNLSTSHLSISKIISVHLCIHSSDHTVPTRNYQPVGLPAAIPLISVKIELCSGWRKGGGLLLVTTHSALVGRDLQGGWQNCVWAKKLLSFNGEGKERLTGEDGDRQKGRDCEENKDVLSKFLSSSLHSLTSSKWDNSKRVGGENPTLLSPSSFFKHF